MNIHDFILGIDQPTKGSLTYVATLYIAQLYLEKRPALRDYLNSVMGVYVQGFNAR